MIIKNKSKFALVGHGFHLFELYKELVKNNFPNPIIITHAKEKHYRDIRESNFDKNLYISVIELEKKTKVYYQDKLNFNSVLKILKKNNIEYIFSCSSRFIFKKDLLDLFKNRVFNIHPSHLPEEKGGGVFTYRIFNEKWFCTACIHLVDEGIDTGKILIKEKKFYIKKNSPPSKFLKETNKIYSILIKKFIKKIINQEKFLLKKQNSNLGTYFTRFFTDKMGFINWQLDGKSIANFILGCSKPYSGSSTFILYKKKLTLIKIFKSKFIKLKKKFHPFFVGKIFFEDIKVIKVAALDGYLVINKNDIFVKKQKIKNYLGKTLFNTQEKIISSQTLIPNINDYK